MRKTSSMHAARAAALLALGLLACSDSTGPDRRPARLEIASTRLAAGIGDTVALEAIVLDQQEGVLRDAAITWQSLDPAKARLVPGAAWAVALDTGTARLVASSGTLRDTVALVIANRVASLTLGLTPDSLLVGNGVVATVVARDAAGNVIAGAPLAWTSADTGVVRVTPAGSVTGVGEGSTTIRVASGTATAERTLRVRYRRLFLDGAQPVNVQLGGGFGCVLDTVGVVRCWGSDVNALGRGAPPLPAAPSLAPVAGDVRFAQLDADARTACAITDDGRLHCWGFRASPPNASMPTEVMAGTPMQAVRIGSEGANCALATDGVAWCWGRNDAYQTGFGPLASYATPQAVTGDLRFMTLGVGFHDLCAVAPDGAAWCWGDHTRALGRDDALADRPMRVQGVPALVEVVATSSPGLACGRTADGAVWCWGYVDGGATAPTRLATLPPMRALSASYFRACGLATDGTVWCWSDSRASLERPWRWGAPYTFTQVDVGQAGGMCGITTGREVLCTYQVAAQ